MFKSCLPVIEQKTFKQAYLVLQEQHHISWAHIQSFLQVRGQLLLLHDVARCGGGLTGQRDPGGGSTHIMYCSESSNTTE